MINEKFQAKLENALTSELISYVAGYRALGLNKDRSIACMVELDKRRQNGDSVDCEQEIENQASIIRAIGKGFIVVTLDGIQLDDLCEKIKEITYCMVVNRQAGLIHIGLADLVTQQKITALPGVKEIVKDGKVLSNVVASTELS